MSHRTKWHVGGLCSSGAVWLRLFACSQAFWCQDSLQTASILSIWWLAPVSSNTYVSLPAALREMMKQRMWRDQSTKWSENPYAGCIRPAWRRFYFFFHCSWISLAVSKCSCRNHQEIRYLDTVRPSFLTCLELEAPALKAVQNERVVFSSAFGIEQSPFQGKPNERNNRLWADLYDCKAFEAYAKSLLRFSCNH